MSGLHFDFTGNPSGLVNAANQSRIAIQGITDEADKAGMKIDEFLGASKSFVSTFTGFSLGAAGISAITKQIVNVRSEFQNTEAMFKVFLHDSEKAAAFMEEIQAYAFNNVFEFGDLTQQAAQLMAYGTAQDKVIDTLDRLSNVAAGVNVPLQDLVATYNKAKATDTLDSQMMASLSAKGIRVREILAEMKSAETGENITAQELEGMTLKFEDLEKVLKHVTDEGGMYYGMMEEKMKTIGDSVGLLEDSITNMFNEMGQALQEPLTDAIKFTAKLAENWREIIKILAGVAAAYGTIKAASAMNKAWNNAQSLYSLNAEKEALQDLNKKMEEYKRKVLETSVADMQAAAAKGQLTNEQMAQLAQKEQELAMMDSKAQLDAAVATGQMSASRAEEIQRVREEIAEKERLFTMEQSSLQDEIAAYSERERALTAQKESADDMIQRYQSIIAGADEQTEALTIQTAAAKIAEQTEISNSAATELNTISKQKNAAEARLSTVQQGLSTLATQKDTIATNANSAAKRVGALVTKSLKLQFEALKVSMMTNPLGWIMAAIAGLVSLITWWSRWRKAHDYAGQAAEKTAEAQSKAASSAAKEQRQLSDLVAQIKLAQKNGQDYSATKEKLIAQFGKYDDNLRKELQDINNLDAAYKKLSDSIMHSANVRAYNNYVQETNNEIDESVEETWKKISKTLNDNVDDGDITQEQSSALLAQLHQVLDGNLDEMEKYFNEHDSAYEALRAIMKDHNNEEAYQALVDLDGEHSMASKIKEHVLKTNAKLKELNGAMDLFNVTESEIDANSTEGETAEQAEQRKLVEGKNYQELLALVEEYEQKLAEARKRYRETGSAADAQDLQRYEGNVKKIGESIQKMTGYAYNDESKLREERRKAIQKAANEEAKIINSSIKDERKKRKAEYDQQIAELRQEEEEYKRTHQGRGSGTLDKKLSNAKLQFDLDMKDLDRQWNEWKRNHEREIIHMQVDLELKDAQNELANAVTIKDQLVARDKVREIEDRKAVAANSEAKENELLQKLGGDRSLLDKYQNAEKGADIATLLGIDKETADQLADIESHYAELLQMQQRQTDIARGQEDYRSQMDRLQSYYNEIEQIEQDHAQKMLDFEANGATNEEVERENFLYEERKKQAGKNLSSDVDEQAFAKRMSDFAQAIAGQSFEEIQSQYKDFLDKLNTDISNLQAEIENAKNQSEQNTRDLAAAQSELTTFDQTNAADMEGLSEDEKNAKFAERAALVQRIKDLETSQGDIAEKRADNEQRLLTLINGREQAEQSALNAEENALTKREVAQQVLMRETGYTQQAFGAVKSAAQSLANTLGGALSEEGEKALQGIMDIADIGMQSCQAIQAVAEASSIAVTGTASAAEKASLILMAISVVVQLAMKVVEFFSQFTASAKMQKEIDKDIANVDRLKREQEKLNNSYKSEAGSDYYKGMAKAAKNYYNLIIAQEKTVADARKKSQHEAEKHGSDSKKGKEAQKQLEEQEDVLEELRQKQKEMYDEMAKDLLTTDLHSFSENLADQYLEGFEKGMDGINGVFDSVMNDLQKNMMKKGLSIALENLFKDTWDRIKAMTEDGDLTTSEMDAIMAEMDAKAAQSKRIAEQYYNAMSERGLLGDGDVETSSGGFDAMTQDQADTLSARFTALQIEGANVVTATQAMMTIMEQLGINDAIKTSTLNQMMTQFTLANEIALNQLDELRKITENTSTLADTNRRLRAIEDNTNSLRE